MEIIEEILEKSLVQVLSQRLPHLCRLSIETIKKIFGKAPEDMTEVELESLRNRNKDAAWAMYIEMITRITMQPLSDEDGDEKTALDSVYSLFSTTRNILKDSGLESPEFSKLAVLILNQKVRPFTAKWHRLSLAGGFENPVTCAEFREELKLLKVILCGYMESLAALAGVEDFTDISDA